jgi:hypothetical protein
MSRWKPITVALVFAYSACAIPRITANSSPPDRLADSGFDMPREAVSDFMRVLFADTGNLLRDDPFKRRFLSARLRAGVELAVKQFDRWAAAADPDDVAQATAQPSNDTLLNAWDHPSRYTISVGRQRRTSASYDVVYHWGQGTEYSGHRRTTTVRLAKENGRWYIDDLYTHAGKFEDEQSLYKTLIQRR